MEFLDKMKIENIRLSEIKPYENNPRHNESAVQYIKNSIREFGFKVPIVIDKDNIIVCGHTRYLAAQELGMDSIPCVRADELSPEQVKAFRIADNKTAELAGWKTKLLDEELKELCEFDMTAFGFPEYEEKTDTGSSADEKSEAVKTKMVRCPHCGEWLEAKKVKIRK